MPSISVEHARGCSQEEMQSQVQLILLGAQAVPHEAPQITIKWFCGIALSVLKFSAH